MLLPNFALAFLVCVYAVHSEHVISEHVSGDMLKPFNVNLELDKAGDWDSRKDSAENSAILPAAGLTVQSFSEHHTRTPAWSGKQLFPRGNTLSCLKGGFCLKQSVHEEDASASANKQEQEIRQGLQIFLENEGSRLIKLHYLKLADSKANGKRLDEEYETLRRLLKISMANKDMYKTVKQILSRNRTDRVLQELQVPRQALVAFLSYTRQKELDFKQNSLLRWIAGHNAHSERDQALMEYFRAKSKADHVKMQQAMERMKKLGRQRIEHQHASQVFGEKVVNIVEIYGKLEGASPTTKRLVKQAGGAGIKKSPRSDLSFSMKALRRRNHFYARLDSG